jgi:regulator of RNase E activity RraA
LASIFTESLFKEHLMPQLDPTLLKQLKTFDSATLFNALVEKLGLPNKDYTDHHIRSLLPSLGSVVGYVATAEVTTNEADSPALPWLDYYDYLDQQPGPLIAVLKDVDSRPGRGASFGDGMATLHKRLGVVGAVVDGTVRDLKGIEQVGLPIWAWGRVPGHGVFNLTRFDTPITVGQLRLRPGDILLADGDGCVRIPPKHAADIVRLAGEIRAREADMFAFYNAPDFSIVKLRARQAG